MKKILLTAVIVVVSMAFVGNAMAISSQYRRTSTTPKSEQAVEKVQKDIEKSEKHHPKFPEKGWHKGPYLTITGGMMQVTNDRHSVTGRKFDGPIDPAMGITFGWDIADWIGPMLQITYATASSQVGDPANAAAATTYNGVTYPAGTFPVENARQHVLDFGLYCRATLPYFTRANWQWNNLKIIPYAKLGGVGHGLFVNAPNGNNKVGAVGGGIGVGAGVEFFIWKGLYVGLDLTEHFIFQKSFYRNLTDSAGTTRNTKVTAGGMKMQFLLLGMLGWHF